MEITNYCRYLIDHLRYRRETLSIQILLIAAVTSPIVSAQTAPTYDQVRQEIFEWTNVFRMQNGTTMAQMMPLVRESRLDQLMQNHVQDKAMCGYSTNGAHVSCDGRTLTDRLQAARTNNGLTYTAAGENMAYGQTRSRDGRVINADGTSNCGALAANQITGVIDGWGCSPGHRRNMLGEFNSIGMGAIQGTLSGSGSRQGFIYGQLFATLNPIPTTNSIFGFSGNAAGFTTQAPGMGPVTPPTMPPAMPTTPNLPIPPTVTPPTTGTLNCNRSISMSLYERQLCQAFVQLITTPMQNLSQAQRTQLTSVVNTAYNTIYNLPAAQQRQALLSFSPGEYDAQAQYSALLGINSMQVVNERITRIRRNDSARELAFAGNAFQLRPAALNTTGLAGGNNQLARSADFVSKTPNSYRSNADNNTSSRTSVRSGTAKVWARPSLRRGQQDPLTGLISGFDYQLNGIMIGVDVPVHESGKEHKVAGIFLGYNRSDVDYDATRSESDGRHFMVGGYYSTTNKANGQYVNLMGSIGRSNFDHERAIFQNNTAEQRANSDYNSLSLTMKAGIGRMISYGKLHFEPALDGFYHYQNISDIQEKGAPAGFNLRISGRNQHTVGTQAGLTILRANRKFSPYISFNYLLEQPLGSRKLKTTYLTSVTGVTGPTVSLDGRERAIHSYVQGLGANININDNFSIQTDYRYTYSKHRQEHYAHAALNYRF